MKELHVSTEIKGRTTLDVVGRIIADMWGEYKDTFLNWQGYKEEGATIEANHADGILAGLDLAMESIINTICPDYFTPNEEISDCS